MKCRYITDKIAGKVFIPGCDSAAYMGQDHCTCRVSFNTKKQREITGHDKGNVAMDFFKMVLEDNGIDPKHPTTFAEYETINKNDDWVHMLLIKGKLKASVIERRDDMNYIEYSFAEF